MLRGLTGIVEFVNVFINRGSICELHLFCASWRSLHVLSLNWLRVLDFGWGLADILEKGFLLIMDKNDYGM